MTEADEIVTALANERDLKAKAMPFEVEEVRADKTLWHVTLEPGSRRSELDDNLEGLTAGWPGPIPGHANILAVVPERHLVTLRFATSAPPPPGSVLFVHPIDFLDKLHALWKDEAVAARCLEWLHEVRTRNAYEPAVALDPARFRRLRLRQKEAFKLAGWKRSFLWGPPGTGKTTTIGCMLAEYLRSREGARVLLLSTTNSAVDLALGAVDTALAELGDGRAEHLRSQAKRIGLHFVPEHYEGRGHLLPDIDETLIRQLAALQGQRPDPEDAQAYHSWKLEIDAIRERIRQQAREALERAWLVAMTTTRATFDMEQLSALEYDLVVFDEASQVSLAHAIMLGQLGDRALFAGDPMQLAPIVECESDDALKWLGESMFCDMNSASDFTCRLNEQSRMSKPICDVVSQVFYGGDLRVADDCPPRSGAVEIRKIQQEGTYARPGRHRPLSAATVAQTVKDLLGSEPQADILVLTPFRAQRRLIRSQLAKAGHREVPVSTVHRAQGTERQTVIFDPVRGDSKFLNDEAGSRLINVAISRAQERLILMVSCGDRKNVILDAIVQTAQAHRPKTPPPPPPPRPPSVLSEIVGDPSFPKTYKGARVVYKSRWVSISSVAPDGRWFELLGPGIGTRGAPTLKLQTEWARRHPEDL